MHADGPVELTLVIGRNVSTCLLGSVVAGPEGHFQSFVIVPGDVPTGSYSARTGLRRSAG